jgi:hypothetical protein
MNSGLFSEYRFEVAYRHRSIVGGFSGGHIKIPELTKEGKTVFSQGKSQLL